MGISKICVKRPVATIMAILVCMCFGLLGIMTLSMDLMPNMNIPVALVSQAMTEQVRKKLNSS